MLTALLVAQAVLFRQSAVPTKWYGPVTVSFEVQFGGNPYDPDENDVRVLFVPQKGVAVERMAYFDGVEGAYRAVLVAPQSGEYRAILVRNGHQVEHDPVEGRIVLKDSLKHGFVHVDPVTKTRFRWDDGTPYYPLGGNLGWQRDGGPKMVEQLAKMADAGANWARIWATSRDGKNPWWPNDTEGVSGQLWTPALARWAELLDGCEKDGIEAQMVLFDHGAFSTKSNPGWADSPWNSRNGGFLKDAATFFTDSEAKRRTKMWLRYAVARWGSSPSLLSWELFDEVDATDARDAGRWDDVVAWHKEMADYIRSIDPYKHPVTTSAATDQPSLWESMDYDQVHIDSREVARTVASQAMPKDKPFFIGQLGTEGDGEARKAFRDGIYTAIAAGQSGAAQWGDWNALDKQNLYGEIKIAADVLARTGIPGRGPVHPLKLTLGPGLVAVGCSETDMTMVRITGVPGTPVALGGLPIPDGSTKLHVVDLDTGDVTVVPAKVEKSSLYGFTMSSKDIVIIARFGTRTP